MTGSQKHPGDELSATSEQGRAAMPPPSVDALRSMEGRQVAMLDQHERDLLRFFMNQGRKNGVLVKFDTDTDQQGWEGMNAVRSLEVLAAANSYIRLQFTDEL